METTSPGIGRLRHYYLRSLLAGLGVAVGAGTMVMLANLTSSAVAGASHGMSTLGGNTLLVRTNDALEGPDERRRLTLADIDAIVRSVPHVRTASSHATFRVQVQACGQRQVVAAAAADDTLAHVDQLEVATGRFLLPDDERTGRAVAVVGATILQEFPCLRMSRAIRLNGREFDVVGYLAPRRPATSPANRTVYLPAGLASRHFLPADVPVAAIVRVENLAVVGDVHAAVRQLLRARHRRPVGSADDVIVQTRSEALAAYNDLERVLDSVVLWLVGLSLVVATIGTLNALMTAVLERTPEIGLRRAVGATRGHVRRQFAEEALAVSASGGLAGIFVGTLTSVVASWTLGLPVRISGRMTMTAAIGSVVLGLVAGVWPALRAACVAPVDALRYE